MANALLNQPIADLELNGTNNLHHSLKDLSGKNLILYFYPKDNTPGCTSEAKSFRDHYAEFEKLNTLIFGISRDSLSSHERYKEKLQLPFELLSDPEEILCNYFEVIKLKNFFGKKIRGIVRSTFLIDTKGILRHEWRKVKIHGHTTDVLTKIREYSR